MATRKQNKNLLIVEDNLADYVQYCRLLETVTHDFDELVHVETIDSALAYLEQAYPLACIMDNVLPDGDALTLMQRIAHVYGKIEFPIVVSTGYGNERLAVELLRQGAQDYMAKDQLRAIDLMSSLDHAVRTYELSEQVNYLAFHDSLTGLVNRKLFMDRLQQTFAELKRYKRAFSVLYIDLDHFKDVNDLYGHDVGDELLEWVGERLKEATRETDTVARLGGDEFAILLGDINPEKAAYVTHKLVLALTSVENIHGHNILISPSVGLAHSDPEIEHSEDLLRRADLALYESKRNGRGKYTIYSANLESSKLTREQRRDALYSAILNKRLRVAYQPIFATQSLSCEHVEALVRWRHQGEDVSPLEIVDLVLDNSMGEVFHQWLFEDIAAQLSEWQEDYPNLHVAINIPGSCCHESALFDALLSAANKYHVDPLKIIVEITESQKILEPDEVKLRLGEAKARGMGVAIDDFGTGFNSLEYLASLPCNILKIDQQFFFDLESSATNLKIIKGITALAHSLGLSVVAEGIKDESAYLAAKDSGCDFVQGFWLARPGFAQGLSMQASAG